MPTCFFSVIGSVIHGLRFHWDLAVKKKAKSRFECSIFSSSQEYIEVAFKFGLPASDFYTDVPHVIMGLHPHKHIGS